MESPAPPQMRTRVEEGWCLGPHSLEPRLCSGQTSGDLGWEAPREGVPQPLPQAPHSGRAPKPRSLLAGGGGESMLEQSSRTHGWAQRALKRKEPSQSPSRAQRLGGQWLRPPHSPSPRVPGLPRWAAGRGGQGCPRRPHLSPGAGRRGLYPNPARLPEP